MIAVTVGEIEVDASFIEALLAKVLENQAVRREARQLRQRVRQQRLPQAFQPFESRRPPSPKLYWRRAQMRNAQAERSVILGRQMRL